MCACVDDRHCFERNNVGQQNIAVSNSVCGDGAGENDERGTWWL